MKARHALFLYMAVAAVIVPRGVAAGPEPLRLTQTISLPGVSGRMDHFACDASTQRLLVAALGNDTVEVLDLKNNTRLTTLRDQSKPQGVAFLTEPKRIFVANGSDGSLREFDAASYSAVARIEDMDDADNVRLDAEGKLLYVGFGNGALAAIDPAAGRLLYRIPLAGHPESFQLETLGRRIFVNLPDVRQIAVVDRDKKSVVAIWSLKKWRGNYPMALDEANHRLFVGCRSPARLVVIDTTSGAAVTDLEISGDTDDLFYDAKRQRIYASCGEGFVDVIEQQDRDHYVRTTRIATRDGARTGFFSPQLDRLYLAVPKKIGHEAEIRVFQPQ